MLTQNGLLVILFPSLFSPAAVMSLADPTSDTTPFLSDDSEAEGSEEPGAGPNQRREEEEPASGVSSMRAVFTVIVLCFINLLNYMDRFTVAGIDNLTLHQHLPNPTLT